jgi:RimJ/RimL family protein N-acetyltransferase
METSPPVVVPRLTTPRLRLREFRVTDFEAFAAHRADEEACRWVGGVLDRRAAWRAFASQTGNWMLQGLGWWIVERLDGAEAVGTAGLFRRFIGADLEIGWSFYRASWGQGFAKEAARAALEHGFAIDGVRRVIAHINHENLASLGVGRHLGMRHERDVDFYGEPIMLHAVER